MARKRPTQEQRFEAQANALEKRTNARSGTYGNPAQPATLKKKGHVGIWPLQPVLYTSLVFGGILGLPPLYNATIGQPDTKYDTDPKILGPAAPASQIAAEKGHIPQTPPTLHAGERLTSFVCKNTVVRVKDSRIQDPIILPAENGSGQYPAVVETVEGGKGLILKSPSGRPEKFEVTKPGGNKVDHPLSPEDGCINMDLIVTSFPDGKGGTKLGLVEAGADAYPGVPIPPTGRPGAIAHTPITN